MKHGFGKVWFFPIARLSFDPIRVQSVFHPWLTSFPALSIRAFSRYIRAVADDFMSELSCSASK
jgi:hypothetical protein